MYRREAGSSVCPFTIAVDNVDRSTVSCKDDLIEFDLPHQQEQEESKDNLTLLQSPLL